MLLWLLQQCLHLYRAAPLAIDYEIEERRLEMFSVEIYVHL